MSLGANPTCLRSGLRARIANCCALEGAFSHHGLRSAVASRFVVHLPAHDEPNHLHPIVGVSCRTRLPLLVALLAVSAVKDMNRIFVRERIGLQTAPHRSRHAVSHPSMPKWPQMRVVDLELGWCGPNAVTAARRYLGGLLVRSANQAKHPHDFSPGSSSLALLRLSS